MSEHEHTRELLALAASGALSEQDAARVERHLAGCAECGAEMGGWQAIARALRRLPTPQPSAQVVARARAAVLAELEAARARRQSSATVIFLGLFAWSFTVAGWLMSVLLAGGPAGLSQLVSGRVPIWLVAYTGLAWVAASTAAVVLGGSRRQGRMA